MAGTGPIIVPPLGDIVSASGNTAGTLALLQNTTVVLAGGNNVTLSQSGNTISINAATIDAGNANTIGISNLGNTAGTSGVVSGPALEVFLAGGNNITLSQSINGSTATISVVGPNQVLSQYEPWQFGANSSASSLGVSSLYLQHMDVPDAIQLCRMDRLVSLSLNAAISGSTNHTGTRSNVWTYNETLGLFTRGLGTNSTNLYSYMSNSWSFGITESVSVQTTNAATNMSVGASYTLGFVSQIDTNGGFTSGTFGSTASSSSASTSVSVANPISNVTGILLGNMPFGSTLLSAGDYWLGIVGQTGATSGGTATTNASLSNIVLTNFNQDLARLGQTATANSNTLIPGNGAFSAQTAAFPTSLAINAISNNSNVSLYGNFLNLPM